MCADAARGVRCSRLLRPGVAVGHCCAGIFLTICVSWLCVIRTPTGANSVVPAVWPTQVPDSWPPANETLRLSRMGYEWTAGFADDEFMALRVRSGWPFKALWLAHHRPPGSPTNVFTTGWPVPQACLAKFGINRSVWIPLRPGLFGFIANTVFYATLSCALLSGPGVLRQLRRRKGHRCPICGYPECGDTCPECGRAAN